MATSAATLMKVIEVMVDARPKTVDKALEVLGGEGLLPAKLLADRIEVKPRKESRFASVEAEMFAVQQKVSIPEGFRGSGKAGKCPSVPSNWADSGLNLGGWLKTACLKS